MFKNYLKKGIIVLILLTVGFFSVPAQPARAATNERMMDDSVFDNSGSMSAVDIQNFLNQFPNSCLKNYTDEYPTDYFNYGGSTSAANVIRRASDLWGISPRVILAKLEQESNLVTGNAGCPLWRYVSAVGYNCPGPTRDAVFRGTPVTTCVRNDANMGFSRQVTKGGWLLKWAKERANDNLGWLVPDDASIYYYGVFTNAGNHRRCGTCSLVYHDGTFQGVDVQTGATASLYNYTPFLNQGFDEIFKGWFGSTYGFPYQWQFVGQSSSNSVVTGQKATWTVYAKNAGSVTWYNSGANPVMLGTSNARDRSSAFCTSSWYGCSRAAKLNESSVAPGATGTFTFEVQAPNVGGTYNEYFNLVAEGAAWMNDPGLFFQTPTPASTLSSSIVSNNFPTSITAGASANVTVTVQNTGTAYWYNNGKFPVNLGTYSPIDRTSVFSTPTWLSTTRPAKMTEATVAPGQTATYNFAIKAPGTPNSYNESFSLVADGWAWFNQPTSTAVNVGAYVPPPEVVSTLSANQSLASNQVLRSQDSRYRLVMQSDGNLVLYSPNRPLWATRTQGTPANLFVVQGDGNLVVYDNTIPRPYWNSGTHGRGGNVLVMQDDGNLVLYNPQGQPIWHTQTAGRL